MNQNEEILPKRMMETNTFEDPFVMGLEGRHKLLWFFMLQKCDHAGVWKCNFMLAAMLTGFPQDEESALKAFKEKIKVLGNGYWWLTSFCKFQYGLPLNSKDNAHRGAAKVLKAFGLLELVEGATEALEAPSHRLPAPSGGSGGDKVQVQVKSKAQDQEEDFNRFWNICSDKRGKEDAQKAWVKLKEEEKLEAIRARPIYDAEQKRKGTEQQYIKSPGPWLTSKRWEEVSAGAGACQHDWRRISQGIDDNGNLSFKLKCHYCGKSK